MENVEIERKFLVADPEIVERSGSAMGESLGTSIVQGYFEISKPDRSLRVRVTPDQATLTLKGPREGAVRIEYEAGLTAEMALQLLALCEPRVVSKTRYPIVEGGHLWVVDVFHDTNDGLVLAEVELDSPHEEVETPSWCGDEVTSDDRYYNHYLAEHPYRTW